MIFLLGGLGALYGLTHFFPARSLSERPAVEAGTIEIYKNENQHVKKIDSPNTPLTMEPFDPHEISEQGWVERGISERTAHTIRNYLSKGGPVSTGGRFEKEMGIGPGRL